jgi:hypothetical protein
VNPAFVEAVAVVGPGLPDWCRTADVLRDPSAYLADEVAVEGAVSVMSNERRRTTVTIRLALQVLDQLTKGSSLDLSRVTSVFATSWGDLQVIENLLTALVTPGIPVSPVQFSNLVHNAPAGYWSIGAGARRSSTSVTAGEETFAAGLVDALVWVNCRNETVLYVCYDHPGPAIVDRYHPVGAPFAVALALTAEPTSNSCCTVEVELGPEQPETAMEHPDLERLRGGNPAARALPLLRAIATGTGGRVVLSSDSGRSSLVINVVPRH